MRRTARSTRAARPAISAGDQLLLLYGAANRDPREFAEPDTLDVTRAHNRHVAFGFGTHVCLGAHLARLEIRVMFEELLRRMPGWELVDPASRRSCPPPSPGRTTAFAFDGADVPDPYPDLYQGVFLPDLLVAALRRDPERPVVYLGDQVLTAAELSDQISRYAQAYADRGVVQGSGVAMLSINRSEVLYAQGAYMTLGDSAPRCTRWAHSTITRTSLRMPPSRR